jgi:hypothetical protein
MRRSAGIEKVCALHEVRPCGARQAPGKGEFHGVARSSGTWELDGPGEAEEADGFGGTKELGRLGGTEEFGEVRCG